MFEDQQSRKPGVSLKLPAIVLACGGGALLLGFGLCGAFGAVTAAAHHGFRAMMSIGAFFFFAGLATICVGVVWLIIAAIISAVRG